MAYPGISGQWAEFCCIRSFADHRGGKEHISCRGLAEVKKHPERANAATLAEILGVLDDRMGSDGD